MGIGAGRNGTRRRSDRVVVTTTERRGDFEALAFGAAAFFADFFTAVFLAGFFAAVLVFVFGLVVNLAFLPALELVFGRVFELVRGLDPVLAREGFRFAAVFFFTFAAMVARLR